MLWQGWSFGRLLNRRHARNTSDKLLFEKRMNFALVNRLCHKARTIDMNDYVNQRHGNSDMEKVEYKKSHRVVAEGRDSASGIKHSESISL